MVHFTHADTNVTTCSCGTVLQRLEGVLILAKPFYIIPTPSDLLQPGTEGTWKGRTFTVLGRFRSWFIESVFNYWTIVFSDGALAWLGEGYGMYSMMLPTRPGRVITPEDLDSWRIGNTYELVSQQKFLLEKISDCYKWEIEGELYLPGTSSEFQLFEFSASDGLQMAIFKFMKYLASYEVYYEHYSALEFNNTRADISQPKTFTCTECDQPVSVLTWPLAQSCACMKCGTYFEFNKSFQFKPTGKRNLTDNQPAITPGSSAMIKGISYQVIGWAQKEEDNEYHAQWNEYTLYNREEGFAFLSEYSGHWTYLREQGDTPVLPSVTTDKFIFDEEPFQLYNKYNFFIINALGEFPYNIFQSRETKAREFISPPEIWILETNPQKGITWFHGEHVDGRDLKDLDMPAGLPYKEGIGAVEPKNYISPEKLIRTSLLAILALLILHLSVSFTRQNRVLYDQQHFFPDSANTISFITEKFVLDRWSSNLELYVEAPVDNSWFEMNATLVNSVTGKEYSIAKGVEYYYGVSEGESWSEGSRKDETFLTRIPAGNYFLQVQGIREMKYSNPITYFRLKATYDVSSARNLMICILLLLTWPIFQYIRTRNIEKKRWFNSPFSPYNYE